MKKLFLNLFLAFLITGCATTQITESEQPKRIAQGNYEILDLGECRIGPDGKNWCNLAEAVHPKYGHIMQFLDKNDDGVCDEVWLFVYYSEEPGPEKYMTYGPRNCETEMQELQKAIREMGDKFEDHYKASDLLKNQ